ncbi:MAG: hypothetical protein AB2A00_07405 [Myxococcota bacterium]
MSNRRKDDPDATVSDRRAPKKEEVERLVREAKAAKDAAREKREAEEQANADEASEHLRDEPTLAGRPRAKLMEHAKRGKG